jgi:hypothetical protein
MIMKSWAKNIGPVDEWLTHGIDRRADEWGIGGM